MKGVGGTSDSGGEMLRGLRVFPLCALVSSIVDSPVIAF